MNDDKSITRAAPAEMTPADHAKVVESLVIRGDVSGLSPEVRARYYTAMCSRLGLDAHTQPFAFLRLNGKEVMYATRGATDQLARIHRITRKITDGPKVIDLAGTKLVYALCEVSTPDGRVETATATVPLTDPVNVLMKAETKAKRRATLSILGLGMLDEMELETIPASAQSPGGGVDLSQAHKPEEIDLGAEAETSDAQLPPAVEAFYARVAEIDLPGEGVSVWMKHRADLAPLNPSERESAWKALCAKVEDVGKMKNAKVWLKKAIAEEDARRGVQPEEPPPDGTSGPRRGPGPVASAEGSASVSGGAGGAPAATVAAIVPEWATTVDGMRAHLADKTARRAVEHSVRQHGRRLGETYRRLAAERVVALETPADEGVRMTIVGATQLVEAWSHQGPIARKAGAR
jgi:hypothetical protein